ncbi:amidohydrolase family protein [Treponema primitia]|uniref:amidohydrolase family protein n=1 Tax=Treponema primitia TaxID=88058 RepID=UPI0002555737|nr:amidohydrolase family protein [Treponema primitia]
MVYDIWIRNARIIDPRRNLDQKGDLFIYNGKIMPPPASVPEADEIVDAEGCFAFPGLIDFHTHLARGLTDIGLAPDVMTLPNGVTAAVDAGSSGWANYEIYRKGVAASSEITIRNFINVSPNGFVIEPYFEDVDPVKYDRKRLAFLFDKYPNELLGLKVRVGKPSSKHLGVMPIAASVELGKELGVRLASHVVEPESPYSEVLAPMRKDDILCHCFQGKGPYSILDSNGKVQKVVREARDRGVVFDAASGRANYSFGIAQKALDDGFYPDIISTDVVTYSIYRRKVFALPYVMSAYLGMGMPLMDVIRAVTDTPAKLMNLPGVIGTLAPGAHADIAIFKLQEKKMGFKDQFNNVVDGKGLLVPQMTVKDGWIMYRQITFMDW